MNQLTHLLFFCSELKSCIFPLKIKYLYLSIRFENESAEHLLFLVHNWKENK